MDEIKLRNKDIYPSHEVLEFTLGASFKAWLSLEEALKIHSIVPEWRYYRDGNAWLCKMLAGKKNLGWLHVYDGYFMVTFYFTEKYLDKIAELDIPEDIKGRFLAEKPVGKLLPMFMRIDSNRLPESFITLLLFKKSLK